jgi:hypothetical protein
MSAHRAYHLDGSSTNTQTGRQAHTELHKAEKGSLGSHPSSWDTNGMGVAQECRGAVCRFQV